MEKLSLNISLKKEGPPGGSPQISLPEMIAQTALFKGDPGNSFLAPRGVFLANRHLIVSDTGQNRVFIWKDLKAVLASDGYLPPDVVLGQIATGDTGRNANTGVSASSLQYPSGLWSDGQRLIVADAWNHRVLIWHDMPTKHGQAADVVIGQPDFQSNQPNVTGIGQAPSERSLNWCYGVFSDGNRLFIADTGNRRVLVFNTIPTQNFAEANKVIGKTSFSERDYEHEDAIWPYSIKVSPSGAMTISDTQYYRVLLWHDWQTALQQKADVVIGQIDFNSNGMNQYGLAPQANTLSWCYDTCFYRDGLFVADTGNSRVLWFEQLPLVSNTLADNVIGKNDFYTGSENLETIFGTEKTLYWPFSVCADRDYLALADTGNHRIFIHQLNT